MARRRPILILLVTLLATLALTASAEASSIVYIKRGDVWLAKSNGKGQRAITKDGTTRNPYRSPAYSDKGVITAVKGRRDIHSSIGAARGCDGSATCRVVPRRRSTR
jgi:hypothetical protein